MTDLIHAAGAEPVPAESPVPGVQPTYSQIRALEAAMLATGQTIEPHVEHHWADGIYGREMVAEADSLVVGKVHRQATLNVLLEGEITVTTPQGLRRICAPAVFTSPAGTKKVGYAHTRVRWLNVHPTRLTDLAAIESKFIAPEPPHGEALHHAPEEERPCLGQQ